jgi:hypothetical protein
VGQSQSQVGRHLVELGLQQAQGLGH